VKRGIQMLGSSVPVPVEDGYVAVVIGVLS